jgi:hypothetical protein
LVETGTAEALDLSAFVDALRYIRKNDEKLPPTLDWKEVHQNELGVLGVPDHAVQIIMNAKSSGCTESSFTR